MKTIATALCLFVAFSPAYGAQPAGLKAAKALNDRSKAELGVGIRALAFLFDAEPGGYLLKEALVAKGSWKALEELEQAGLVELRVVRGLPDGQEAQTEFVTLRLTNKGQSIRRALLEP